MHKSLSPLLATLLAASAFMLAAPVRADDGEAIIKKARCVACHAVDKKLVGPAYKDVAAKYKDHKEAEAALFDKVRKGGTGVWGQIPMPPNAATPAADISDLVTWILTLKK